MFFSLWRFINPAEAQKRVNSLKREHPGLGREELCWLVIREKSLLCALSGALTALPAVFPVVGTLVALLGGIAVDISLISYFMIRMVMEIAFIYERSPLRGETLRGALWAFTSAAGADAVSKTVGRLSAAQMKNQAVVNLVRQVLLSLGIRSTPRVALRIIPLIGAIVAGGINYFICTQIGRRVANHYRLQWRKETIDVDYEVMD